MRVFNTISLLCNAVMSMGAAFSDGFSLRKCSSNNPELMTLIQREECPTN